jgi:Rieske Fe-S protein
MRAEEDLQGQTVPPDRGKMSQQPPWRHDFPIDRPQDAYLSRRDFTKFLVLTSLGFVVGQFWIAIRNLWRRTQGAPPLMKIASLNELPVGNAMTFHYPSKADPCLLIRPSEDTLVAYASQCTHLQCPVLPEIESGRLHCPCHVGYFDLATGDVLAGPPRRPLPRIGLEIQDGVVYAASIQEQPI